MTRTQTVAAIEAAASLYGGQAAFARELKIRPQYVCDVKNGRRAPSKRLIKGLERAARRLEAAAQAERKHRRARAH